MTASAAFFRYFYFACLRLGRARLIGFWFGLLSPKREDFCETRRRSSRFGGSPKEVASFDKSRKFKKKSQVFKKQKIQKDSVVLTNGDRRLWRSVVSLAK
jgi:hypothetical protein